MDIAQRIAQFENMAQADPSNEMAHFSLAKAYLDAGRAADAAASYLRCIELVPDMSKAYQLAGDALIKAGEKDRAAELLVKGFDIASKKGDRMPALAMADLLKSLGRQPPQLAADAAAHPASGSFVCSKTGRPGTRLPAPPFKGSVGLWIHDHISAETWRAWIGQGTKVINELRLDLSRDQDAETYDRYMREYLGIDDDLLARLHLQKP
jgi:Fe-S cluster biosynthesis and repair protein YggX